MEARIRPMRALTLVSLSMLVFITLGLVGPAQETGAQTTIDFRAGGQVVSGLLCAEVVVGDLDGDGYLDVVTACSDSSGVWINQGGHDGIPGTFLPGTDLGANVASVVLGDLNGDGHLDLILGRRAVNGFNLETWINQGGVPGGKATAFPPGYPFTSISDAEHGLA